MLILNTEEVFSIIEKRGQTITAFCDSAGIARSTFYKWISRPAMLQLSDVQLLADALKVKAPDILEDY